MQKPVTISLVAGLSIAGIGAAAAETDPCVWRYYVSTALDAQHGQPAPGLREGFKQSYERYFADGSATPTTDKPQR
jgi:hypothetical protein